MASNNLGDGSIINITAPFALTAGQLHILSSGRACIVIEDIASGAVGAVALTGEWTATKSAATAGALGAIPRTQSVGTSVPTISLTTAGTTMVNCHLTAATTTAQTTCKIRLF
jgi:predicted RecA/RadA family phage recombinase